MNSKTIKVDDKLLIFRSLKLNDINIHYFKLLEQLTLVDYENTSNSRNKEFFESLTCNHKIIVIEYNNKIVGTGTLLIENKLIRNYGKVGHIEDIVIDKKFRKYGLGKELIGFLVEIATLEKCYKCILDCDDKNKSFYEKCDFKNVGVEMAKYSN